MLIIGDMPEKPYYLNKDFSKDRKRINAGTIYTRIRDANTPQDQVASTSDIEQMWKERFGLSNNPFDRLKSYLLHFNEWEETEENNWHYRPFPEFTIFSTEEETWEVEGGENWVRAATNPRAFVRPMYLRYHQTPLAKIMCIYFDEMRALIPAPAVTFAKENDAKYFYSFCADNFDFIFLQFLLRRTKKEIFGAGLLESRMGKIPVAVFVSEQEMKAFLSSLEDDPAKVEDKHKFLNHKADRRVTDHDREIISYSWAVIERLTQFRELADKR